MAIENFDEVKAYFEANKDNEDVKGYIGGFVDSGRVENFLNSDDGKKILQPKLDQYHSKSLESWKTNNISKLVDEEVKKRFPDADPKDVELKKLQADIEKMKQDALRKDLTNKALKIAQEKNLPTDLIDFFVGDDDEITTANLEKLIFTMAARDEAFKTQNAKDNSYVPPKDDKSNVGADKMREEVRKAMGLK